ncbi:MAG: polymer-forming cytoskeletal protein [Caldiserica bacterium]|nr:MAG: polymer-forming cytoskeletal protein [Caldisericota bacterium]
MFGSTKEEAFPKNGSGSNQTNQFVEGTVIQGEVRSNNDIRVDGVIKGTLQSNSKVVIGAKGKVEGDVLCKNADVSGSIKGRIEVNELLFLKSTAVIDGDIIANKLVVESGAKFNGTCRMGAHQLKNEESATATLKKEAI